MTTPAPGAPRLHVTTELGFVFLDAMPSAAQRWVTAGAARVDVVVGGAGALQAWIDARTADSPLLGVVIGPGPVHGATVVRVDDAPAAMQACAVLTALVGGNDGTAGTVGPLDADDVAALLGRRVSNAAVEAVVVRAHGETFVDGARAVGRQLRGRRVTNAVLLLTFSSTHHPLGDANAGIQLLVDEDDDAVDIVLGMRCARAPLRQPRIDFFALLA